MEGVGSDVEGVGSDTKGVGSDLKGVGSDVRFVRFVKFVKFVNGLGSWSGAFSRGSLTGAAGLNKMLSSGVGSDMGRGGGGGTKSTTLGTS